MKGCVRVRESLTQPAKLRVDAAAGIAYDVKILGWESRNNARYDAQKCSTPECLSCYEGVVVNIDHNTRAGDAPAFLPFMSRFGRLSGPYAKPDGIYAREFRFNPKHQVAEQFAWFAANDPAAIGLSHVATCRTAPGLKDTVYEAIVEVTSVDVVANPATTKGLYESSMDPNLIADPAAGAEDYETQLGKLVSGIVTDASLSSADKRKKVLAALKLLDDKSEDAGDAEDKPEMEAIRAENRQLKVKLDEFQVRESAAAKVAHVRQLCTAAKLPEVAVTETFVDLLTGLSDDKQIQRAIEDRRDVARGDRKPISPGVDMPKLTMDSFLAAVKGN